VEGRQRVRNKFEFPGVFQVYELVTAQEGRASSVVSDLHSQRAERLFYVSCGRVDLGENAKDSQLIGGFGIGRAGVCTFFRLCRDAFASERVPNSTNKNGLRAHGKGPSAGAARWRCELEQELLRDFGCAGA
jgi:hypothetical protein